MNPYPLFFFGHGSPMNAIEDTPFAQAWKKEIHTLPKPDAILCISAHWCTGGTKVTAEAVHETIHDFYGFPQELYDIQYPAPGKPTLAHEINVLVGEDIQEDHSWGLDHGTWSILTHIFPEATIPVLQLSLDYKKTPGEHYELAKKLTPLREKNILIMGSGNIVHNLHNMDPERDRTPFPWAVHFDAQVADAIRTNDHNALVHYHLFGQDAHLSIPTNEHFLPLLYILALQGQNEHVSFFAEGIVHGSISMRSLRIG